MGGLRVERLAGIRPPATTNDVVRIDIGRVVLRPSTSYSVDAVAGVSGIAIEAGTLELGAMDGLMEIQLAPSAGEPRPVLRLGEPLALSPGDGVIVPPRDEAEIRNRGATAAVALVVVLTSTDAMTLSPTPTPNGTPAPVPPTSTPAAPFRGQPS